jgi:hypothetical protein
MDPKQYFQEGSKGFVITTQALDTIAKAQASGLLTQEQAEQQRNALEAAAKNLKASGGKNAGGFEAQLKVIGDIGSRANQAVDSKKTLSANIQLLSTYGKQIPTQSGELIKQAAKSNDPVFIDKVNSTLASQIADLAKAQAPATPLEQAKIETEKQAFGIAKQKAAKEKEEADNARYSLEETLKDKYKSIIEVKTDPNIKSAFGVPFSRLVPGTESSSLSAKVGQIANKEWIDAIIESKAAGATFGSLTEKEGAKLASAATLLSAPSDLNYETANDELLRMAESVKKLYRKSTGREITDDIKIGSPTPPDAMTPQQEADAKAAKFRGILEGAP